MQNNKSAKLDSKKSDLLPGAFQLHSPLKFAAARDAFTSGRAVKGCRDFGVDPHIVTRGSGMGVKGGSARLRTTFEPLNSTLSDVAKWDWYQSTVFVADPSASGLVDVLLAYWELSDYVPYKNLNGYKYGAAIVRGERVLCHLCWGGQAGVNCKTTSEESHVLAAALKAFGKTHRPTRVDACLDWQEDGLYDSLSAALIAFAQQGKGLAINQQGDWVRGEARTLYLGSKNSPIRLVLYEKGYEQGGEAPRNWVRLEVRVRPKKEHREAVAGWQPSDAFGAGWVSDACKFINLAELQKRTVGTTWQRSDDERARYALLKQYGKTLLKWASEHESPEAFGAFLMSELDGSAADKRAEQALKQA